VVLLPSAEVGEEEMKPAYVVALKSQQKWLVGTTELFVPNRGGAVDSRSLRLVALHALVRRKNALDESSFLWVRCWIHVARTMQRHVWRTVAKGVA
jgi:hypothetical protein